MMKAARVLTSIKSALSNLNPSEVRESAHMPFSLELHAASPRMYEQMENFFTPSQTLSPSRRAEVLQVMRQEPSVPGRPIIRVYEKGMVQEFGPGFSFDTLNPDQVVCDVLERHPDLKLSLARQLHPFREQVSKDLILQIAKENALFSIATAVPSMMPLIAIPWAAGEFASDTAFLTANQIRMAFMLAAASDRTVGYREQKAEIGSLFAGAFGWRALARELVGKIPMGGGIVPKAAISFAATYVVGISLDRYYRLGYGLTPAERQKAYAEAVERGKAIAASLLNVYKPKANT